MYALLMEDFHKFFHLAKTIINLQPKKVAVEKFYPALKTLPF